MKKEAKRILIFNVNWLGDVLFSTPVIRNIRRNFPDSFISCIIPSRCYQILKGNPHLDDIIIFDEKDRHRGLFAKLEFVRMLKAKKFDTVFLLHRSFRRALISRLAGISERIGYDTKKRGFLLTQKFPMPQKDSIHRIDFYLNIIEQAGLKIEDRYLEFFVSDEDVKYVDNFLKKHAVGESDFLVALNPGGNWMPKRWPKAHWAALADSLISDFGSKVVITGAHHDAGLAKDIAVLMKEKPLIACGVFNVKQLGALAKRVNLFITADTGPLHIATAVEAKHVIALFGPTSPLITGPFPVKNAIIMHKNVHCRIPCYQVHCKDNRCMKVITPQDVLSEISKLQTPKQ